jgi:hypothetical protein
MNVLAALLGFFVLKPVIKARLAAPARSAAPESGFADDDVGKRRAVG